MAGASSVPLADDAAGALERLYRAWRFQADDLVFAEPDTGEPLRDRVLIRPYCTLQPAWAPGQWYPGARRVSDY